MVSSSDVLKRASKQNPAIAISLNKLRARSRIEQKDVQAAASSPLDNLYWEGISIGASIERDRLYGMVLHCKSPSDLPPSVVPIIIRVSQLPFLLQAA
jgi:hypothetical protein